MTYTTSACARCKRSASRIDRGVLSSGGAGSDARAARAGEADP
jgi:hypothetical protein